MMSRHKCDDCDRAVLSGEGWYGPPEPAPPWTPPERAEFFRGTFSKTLCSSHMLNYYKYEYYQKR